VLYACVLGSTVLVLSVQGVAAEPGVDANLTWERAQLFHPSKALLLAEAEGRVTIYDGLYRDEVEQAMDQQFGRIDRMMFIRTQARTDSDEVTDDDCN
jgi:hypothetical protein